MGGGTESEPKRANASHRTPVPGPGGAGRWRGSAKRPEFGGFDVRGSGQRASRGNAGGGASGRGIPKSNLSAAKVARRLPPPPGSPGREGEPV